VLESATGFQPLPHIKDFYGRLVFSLDFLENGKNRFYYNLNVAFGGPVML
jgi:hypothetical protein